MNAAIVLSNAGIGGAIVIMVLFVGWFVLVGTNLVGAAFGGIVSKGKTPRVPAKFTVAISAFWASIIASMSAIFMPFAMFSLPISFGDAQILIFLIWIAGPLLTGGIVYAIRRRVESRLALTATAAPTFKILPLVWTAVAAMPFLAGFGLIVVVTLIS